MSVFEITPKTAKERTRIAEHGNTWKKSELPHVKSSMSTLLESVKTGHVRWWNNSQISSKESDHENLG